MELKQSTFVKHKLPCPSCGGSDPVSLNGDGSAKCFSCGTFFTDYKNPKGTTTITKANHTSYLNSYAGTYGALTDRNISEKIAKKYPDYDKMPEVRQQGILVEEMNLRFEELDAKSEDWKKFTAKEAREHARLDNNLYEASEMKEGEEQAKKEIKREQLKSKNPNVTFMEDKKREILERKGVITFPSKLNPKEQERLTDLISRLEEQKEQKRQKKEEAVQERRGQFRVVKKGETGLPVEKQNTNVISDSEFSKRSNTKADIIPISKHRNPNIISKYIKTRNTKPRFRSHL